MFYLFLIHVRSFNNSFLFLTLIKQFRLWIFLDLHRSTEMITKFFVVTTIKQSHLWFNYFMGRYNKELNFF